MRPDSPCRSAPMDLRQSTRHGTADPDETNGAEADNRAAARFGGEADDDNNWRLS